MLQFVSAALISSTTLAFSNSVPVYGTYPGWVQGSGRAGINVEVFIDLMCSDCQGQNPIWNELLQTPWLDGTVAD